MLRRLVAEGHADVAAGRTQPMSDEFLRGVAEHARARAEEIAELADRGGDVSRFFTNQGHMLNISRQTGKKLLRQASDQHDLAQRAGMPRPRD